NTGSVDLIISSATITGADPGDFSLTNNCPTNVASASACTIVVTFTPQPLGKGPRDAALEIASNDPVAPLLAAGLFGSGVYNLTVVNTDLSGGLIEAGCGDGCAISCGGACSNIFPDGSIIVANQSTIPGYVFSGWSSPQATCPGGGPCAVSMNQDVVLTAGFCNGSFSISPTSATFNSFSGSSGSLLVTQLSGTVCGWTAYGNSPVITVTSGVNSSGTGTVDYTVNNSGDLIGSLLAAGQKFMVTRSGVAGGLDAAFGSPFGFVMYPSSMNGNNTTINGAALQADGKIVVTGSAWNVGRGGYDTFVGRYNTDGTPDNTFGTSGIVTYVTPTYSNYGNGIAIQSDGKIVVTGYAYNSTTGDDVLVSRFTSTGALD